LPGGPAAESDSALVSAVRSGSDRAFEELYGRYRRRISAYAYGMVSDHGRAEDVTQEVFISALRRMRATDRPIAFKPWIYEIARNACIDSYRRTTTRAEEVSYDHDGALGPADSRRLVAVGSAPDDAVESKQQLRHLCGAFTGLSQAHHEILVMREFEGISYAEIGERMGLSRPAVESTLFRARRRLAEEYEELVSGRRCERVQEILSAASEKALGARDRERLARHLSYCQPCRRHAHALEQPEPATRRRALAGRLAAIIPLPLLRHRPEAQAGSIDYAATPGTLAMQLSAGVGALEPLNAGWTKTAAAVAAIAAGGLGTGVATHGDPVSIMRKATALVAPAHHRPADARGRIAPGARVAPFSAAFGARSRTAAPGDPAANHSAPAPAPSGSPGAGQSPATGVATAPHGNVPSVSAPGVPTPEPKAVIDRAPATPDLPDTDLPEPPAAGASSAVTPPALPDVKAPASVPGASGLGGAHRAPEVPKPAGASRTPVRDTVSAVKDQTSSLRTGATDAVDRVQVPGLGS
jgi:RNA polymerase sigma factor (sigma-70 family)